MPFEPITGKNKRFPPPPGIEVRLAPDHQRLYRTLYARYATNLEGLPVLRDRDFDGRAVRMSQAQLDALNRAFAAESEPGLSSGESPFDRQAEGRSSLFKRLQYLS